MKRLTLFLAVLLCAVSCGQNNKKEDMKEEACSIVQMSTSLGTMKIQLYNETPRHRDNFIKLANSGYYDKVLFHRVIRDFMIQGGDPLSRDAYQRDLWGTGGPDYTIPAEFVPEIHHTKGALAAARMGDMANPRKASSGSQFYIVQSEEGCSHLDGQYTVFGQVIEGLEVIDRIASVQTDPYDRPIVPVIIDSVRLCVPVFTQDADSTLVQGNAAAAEVTEPVTE